MKYEYNVFWDFLRNQFDKEETERIKKIENGELVRGKDTILIWENMYEIWHNYDGNNLSIYENKISHNILEKIEGYKVKKDKLYIVSKEGYAVIDKNNLCKVFITVPDEDFVNGYSIDEQGNKEYYTRYIENTHIQYLSKFDKYTDEEQEMFNKLKK